MCQYHLVQAFCAVHEQPEGRLFLKTETIARCPKPCEENEICMQDPYSMSTVGPFFKETAKIDRARDTLPWGVCKACQDAGVMDFFQETRADVAKKNEASTAKPADLLKSITSAFGSSSRISTAGSTLTKVSSSTTIKETGSSAAVVVAGRGRTPPVACVTPVVAPTPVASATRAATTAPVRGILAPTGDLGMVHDELLELGLEMNATSAAFEARLANLKDKVHGCREAILNFAKKTGNFTTFDLPEVSAESSRASTPSSSCDDVQRCAVPAYDAVRDSWTNKSKIEFDESCPSPRVPMGPGFVGLQNGTYIHTEKGKSSKTKRQSQKVRPDDAAARDKWKYLY